jgi:hypothetical protein
MKTNKILFCAIRDIPPRRTLKVLVCTPGLNMKIRKNPRNNNDKV